MYSLQDPLNGLKEWSNPVIDTHLHFWNEELISFFFNWAETYFSNYSVVSMMLPEMIPKIPEEYRDRIIIAQFLTTKNVGEYNTSELVKQIDQAYSDGVKVIKLWLAPRFLDFNELKGPFNLLDEKLEPVFSRLEDYNYTVSAHIADPDFWYLFQYQDSEKYGRKIDHINKFLEIHKRFSGIKFFTTHFMCWPENLKNLAKILEDYQDLYINTGSTRWMIRELSKDNRETTEFIKKYQDRIIFGTDLHVTEEPINPEYYASRFWSHRVFWETDIETSLPFPDEDSPFGVNFTGLNLPKEVLDKMYYKNFQNFFSN
ncbi:MAG: hypothetical protein HeimC3_44050 [Candidatus Heimdallarchaeota archaeon LC_3]|nr:MAG: hypothetical protein HeimC3_44050 [Candidatus Heimdallarchaeota archaeon LC_3]